VDHDDKVRIHVLMFVDLIFDLNLVPLINVLVGGTLHSLPSFCIDLERSIPVVIVDVREKKLEKKICCTIFLCRDADHLAILYANI